MHPSILVAVQRIQTVLHHPHSHGYGRKHCRLEGRKGRCSAWRTDAGRDRSAQSGCGEPLPEALLHVRATWQHAPRRAAASAQL